MAISLTLKLLSPAEISLEPSPEIAMLRTAPAWSGMCFTSRAVAVSQMRDRLVGRPPLSPACRRSRVTPRLCRRGVRRSGEPPSPCQYPKGRRRPLDVPVRASLPSGEAATETYSPCSSPAAAVGRQGIGVRLEYADGSPVRNAPSNHFLSPFGSPLALRTSLPSGVVARAEIGPAVTGKIAGAGTDVGTFHRRRA